MLKRIKILLINPGRYLYAYPPLSLGYLASYFKKYARETNKTEIILADENAKDIAEVLIKKHKPQLVGLTATTPQIIRAHAIAEYCKKINPKTICVIGGIHATILPQQTLKKFPCFDLGIYGEGEETFQELADNLAAKNFNLAAANLAAIPGLVWREDSQVCQSEPRKMIADLDRIPIPDKHLYNLKYYLRPRQAIRGFSRRAIQMMSSRGCPYHCRFCSSDLIWQGKVRFHSPERFLAEVEDLHNLGFNGFYLHDDTFIADKDRVRRICALLLEKKFHQKIIWAAQLRPNLIQNAEDVKLLKLMKKAGCSQVEYGFESGADRVLSFLKKDSATVAQNQKAIDLTVKSGLRIFGNFMAGAQGETAEELAATKKFILQNYQKLDYYQVYITTPYPGTELWNLCAKENLLSGVTWEKFGMGILDNFIFSNTINHNLVRKTVQELTRLAIAKISWKDKMRWLMVRSIDDPNYIFKILKDYF